MMNTELLFLAEGAFLIGGIMLRKQFLKSKPVCKVTFKIPADIAKDVQGVHLVGDFNDWKESATPMTRLKTTGEYAVTLELACGHDYQYRYLFNDGSWHNDEQADRYNWCSFANCENSVVSV